MRVRSIAAGPLVVLALSGCTTTQRQNTRAKLSAQREIASREPLRVGRPHPEVRATRVTLLRRGGVPTVVVRLRSTASRPLTDLPIAVGVRTGRGAVIRLNSGSGLGWFQTHVPAIAARGTSTWIFSGRTRATLGGRPFAIVGVAPSPALSTATRLPRIAAGLAPGARGRAGRALVTVRNASNVPQLGLQVYATARAGGRYVSAGKASIPRLGAGARSTVTVPLSSATDASRLRVVAVPTIFE